MRRSSWSVRSAVMGRSVTSAGAIALGGCAADPPVLPPYGEAIVFADTDAPVPRLVSRLRVDVYALDGTWLDSQTIARRNPSDWPASFSVYTDDERKGRDVLVRLRAYPSSKERDYRGERFLARPSAGAPGDPVEPPPPTDAPRLVVHGADQTPATEPLPNLTIDRLIRVRLQPGKRGSVQVVLRGACFGTMADLAGQSSCVDTENVRAPVERARIDANLAPKVHSEVGAFGGATPCVGAPRPASSTTDGTPLYDDDVCAPGGSFILGSPEAVGLGLLDSAPERVVLVPPMFVDRYEVTVGRFRAAIAAGFAPAELPVPNPAPLAASSSAAHITRCTWTDAPLQGAASRESYPLNCVSWTTARSFCAWLGGDFPTETQWEYVASASGRPVETRFPWGQDAARCDGEVFARLDLKETLSTECFDQKKPFGIARAGDAYAGDVTPELGVVGLGGGVGEWVLDAYHPYDTFCWAAAPMFDPRCIDDASSTRMARGGSWAGTSVDMLAAIRGREGQVDTGYAEIGFRCARAAGGP